jgi:hypothetical protein
MPPKQLPEVRCTPGGDSRTALCWPQHNDTAGSGSDMREPLGLGSPLRGSSQSQLSLQHPTPSPLARAPFLLPPHLLPPHLQPAALQARGRKADGPSRGTPAGPLEPSSTAMELRAAGCTGWRH